MGKAQYAIMGCINGTYRLTKWKLEFCITHNVPHSHKNCSCKPPFALIPFPTELRDPEGRKMWIKIAQ